MHVFEVLHHLIKECSVIKWFLTGEEELLRKKHRFLIHKATVWKSAF